MPWLKISLAVDRDRLPLIEAALENAGALAVTLGDAADEPQLEPYPGSTPLWQQVAVSALFADDPASLAACEELMRALGRAAETTPEGAGGQPIAARLERIQDRVWERVWLEDFVPTRFGRHLWVCPRGQQPPDPNAVVVALDPGLAFGTGRHPTTALCLRWLEAAEPHGKSVIDYGCGSGILAIAALRLGATGAVAVDHDPQALEATLANARRNAVADRLLACRPEDVPDEPADLLLANILARPLVALAPRLAALVRSGGGIALSGILCDQREEVEDAYRPWFELDGPHIEGDWVLLAGRRRPSGGTPPGKGTADPTGAG